MFLFFLLRNEPRESRNNCSSFFPNKAGVSQNGVFGAATQARAASRKGSRMVSLPFERCCTNTGPTKLNLLLVELYLVALVLATTQRLIGHCEGEPTWPGLRPPSLCFPQFWLLASRFLIGQSIWPPQFTTFWRLRVPAEHTGLLQLMKQLRNRWKDFN